MDGKGQAAIWDLTFLVIVFMSRCATCISFHVTALALTLHVNFNETYSTLKIRHPSKVLLVCLLQSTWPVLLPLHLYTPLNASNEENRGREGKKKDFQLYQLNTLPGQRET